MDRTAVVAILAVAIAVMNIAVCVAYQWLSTRRGGPAHSQPSSSPASPANEGALAEIGKQIAAIEGRLGKQDAAVRSASEAVNDLKAAQETRVEELTQLVRSTQEQLAGLESKNPSGPAATPAEGAGDAGDEADWLTALRQKTDVREETLRQAAAELRSAAVEAGQELLTKMGEKSGALRGEVSGLLALLRGPALAELEQVGGEDASVKDLLDTVEETLEMAGTFEEGLPDTDRLANPPEFEAELPDLQQEYDNARAGGAEPAPAEFEASFMDSFEQVAEQLLSDYKAALVYQPPEVDVDAMETEMRSILPSLGIMIIESVEDISDGADGGDLGGWCEKHVESICSGVAAAVGLVELPVKKGETFNPSLHKTAPTEDDAEGKADEKKNRRIDQVVRPGYCLGSSSGQALRQATVKVAA